MIPTWKATLIVAIAAALTVLGLAMIFTSRAHADPYCGENSYYDYAHDICQAFPVPPPLILVPYLPTPTPHNDAWSLR